MNRLKIAKTMYFLFLISAFCDFQKVSDITELDKLKSLLNEDDSRKSIEEKVYEVLNINLSTNFGTVLKPLDINELNEILKPLMDKDDLIKSVNDELYKLYTDRNLIIFTSDNKEKHLKIEVHIRENVVPNCLRRLIHTKILILRRNDLTKLPGFFIKFTSLYRLNLSSNKFKKIPKVIFSLINLIDLDLSANKIQSGEDDIERLEKLRFLDLSGNNMETITISKKIKNLTKLIYLDLSCNLYIRLPREHEVNIRNEKEFLRAIPLSVKCLYLRGTLLEYIPCDLIFPNLYILDVNSNYLKDLSLCSIKCFNILVVDASSNDFTSVPPCSDEFKELRKLNLRGNARLKLVFIEKDMFSALEELYLLNCNIKKFEVEGYNIMDSSNGEYIHYENPNINDPVPSNNASDKDNSKTSIIYSLKTFSITIANIFVIPNLLVFPKLLDLEIESKDYRYNTPDATRSWFDGLSQMEHLKTLKVVDIMLITIPPIIFRLKSLQSLTLNDCKLKEISDEITELSNLKHLDLYDNYIDNINPKIFEFKKPIDIILTNNPLTHLPSEINNDELKFKLTIDGRDLVLFKTNENNLGVMDISYKKIHKIKVSDMLNTPSISIGELYDEAHRGEEHKWELKRILKIKQRTIKESQTDYNGIVDYWNILEKYITNNDIKEKFPNYIILLYGIKKRREEGETTNSINNSIQNYLEAVFEILTNLVNTENTDIVETTLNKIAPGLFMDIEDQLEHFSYAYCFLVDNFKELNFIEHFIKNKIASLKYHALWEIIMSNSKNIDVFSYWQNTLSDTLGLPLMPENDYIHTDNWFLKYEEYIIYQFFKVITVKNVVKDLYESINKNHERIMMAYKYISDNNDIENLKEYVQYEGDIKQKNITKITENGIHFILKKMNLITSSEEQKKE